MHAEDLSLHEGTEGKIVKGLIKVVPHVMIAVLLGDLLIEAVDIGDVA